MTGKRGFWNHYPQKLWAAADWAAWEKAGRPEVARELRLPAADAPPLDLLPVVVPTRTVPTGFTLFPTKRTSRDAHSRGVDKLLENNRDRAGTSSALRLELVRRVGQVAGRASCL